MHSIALNVNNNAYEHLMYFLSNLKDDVEVIKDEALQDEFKIDEDYCAMVANKIKLGDTSDFKEVTPEQLIEELM